MRRRERTVVTIAAVLLVILAAQVAGDLRARARRDAVRRELLRFALAQESYYYDHRIYAADPSAMTDRGLRLWAARIVVREATRQGWSAVAEHAAGRVRCFLVVRDAAPVGAATREGEVRCG